MGTFQQRPEGGGRREGQEVILGRSVQAEDTARAGPELGPCPRNLSERARGEMQGRRGDESPGLGAPDRCEVCSYVGV